MMQSNADEPVLGHAGVSHEHYCAFRVDDDERRHGIRRIGRSTQVFQMHQHFEHHKYDGF